MEPSPVTDFVADPSLAGVPARAVEPFAPPSDAWRRVSGRVWRVRPANLRRDGLGWAALGDRVVFVPRRAGAAVRVSRGAECAVRRVVVRASQGAAVAGTATGGMVLDRVTVAPPSGERLLSANSDGALFQQRSCVYDGYRLRTCFRSGCGFSPRP